MNETAIAFEMPHVRAAATQGGPMLDRISVRDYTREVEIGAFRSERGVTQRIRFNVVLEVSHGAAAQADDVDQVISYDTITEAIEAELAAERVNLLETLAERVARRCLADPRAVRVFVRIEKLDRIPGALGVEIARVRQTEAAHPLHPVQQVAVVPATPARVVFLPRSVLNGGDGAAWLEALAAGDAPVVLCLEPASDQPPASTEAELRIGLLSIEQAAWALAGRDPRFEVVAARTELDWALKAGRRPVWAPAKMRTDARDGGGPDASAPAALAGWLAAEIGAAALVVAGAAPSALAMPAPVVVAERPSDLAQPDP